MNEDGFYTLTKSVTDLVKMMVKDKILASQRQWRVRDEDNYNEVREFEDYEENIVSAIDSGAAILQLPQVLSRDLPKCHLICTIVQIKGKNAFVDSVMSLSCRPR